MKKTIVKVMALALVAVMTMMLLASCAVPAKDPKDAKDALEENGYNATKVDADGNIIEKVVITAMEAAGIEDIESVVSGTNDDGETVTIIYFKDKEAANDEWEDVQEYVEDEKDEDEDWIVKKSGNMIYFGTKQGIKDAK